MYSDACLPKNPMHTYLGKLLLGLEALCESPSLVNGYTAGSVATLGHTSVSSFAVISMISLPSHYSHNKHNQRASARVASNITGRWHHGRSLCEGQTCVAMGSVISRFQAPFSLPMALGGLEGMSPCCLLASSVWALHLSNFMIFTTTIIPLHEYT